jgi:PPOX class probable F420-dependent enzyme
VSGPEDFEQLRGSATVLLTTRRRDGRTVDTPVNLVIDADGTGYFRTFAATGKVKRLANYPDVRIAPCSRRGRPSGSDQPAVAEPVTGEAAEHARRLLARRFRVTHGVIVPLVYRLRRATPKFYRVLPSAEPTPWAV